MGPFSRSRRTELAQQPGKPMGDAASGGVVLSADQGSQIAQLGGHIGFEDAEDDPQIRRVDGGAEFVENLVAWCRFCAASRWS